MSGRVNKALRFEDKVAIVTGGCQGIGKGCVDVLVEEGGKVAVFDIKDSFGEDLASKCDSIMYIHCDVRNDDEIKKAIDRVVQTFGKLDLLVNNAAVAPHAHAIDDVTPQDFRDLLNLNLVSYYTMCKYSLPYLRKRKGSIVNISSVCSSAAARNMSMYCATKGGVTSLTKALAIDEAKRGVRMVEDFVASHSNPEEVMQKLTSSLHSDRLGEPREIGLACLYLAVDATFTTGFELNCTAGSEIGYGVKM
ncbi:17-beta-hydroxysteroid dehydrogenase 14-like [Mya arenaria]|uniref:17-beta-hydroxysteroid dehydrogenase 14-like n=1 Tax=Mya arenaria TaxID=6604 RepID=UPI0022E88B1D|nr:17-beta-hydroxysteroid dehydrogenase 14-like [Mya arenaria]